MVCLHIGRAVQGETYPAANRARRMIFILKVGMACKEQLMERLADKYDRSSVSLENDLEHARGCSLYSLLAHTSGTDVVTLIERAV